MALISMRQLLDHAAEHDYGVPAYNVNNLEQMRAIMEAAGQTHSPVCMHQDHGTSPAGWADKIKLISLEDMVQRYDSGELDPQVN